MHLESRGMKTVASLLVIVLIGGSTGAGAARAWQAPQSAAPAVWAPGVPIADCSAVSDLLAKLRAGVPQQEEWIRRTEEQLRGAQHGSLEASAQLREAAMDAVKDLAQEVAGSVALLRARLAALNLREIPRATRQKWVTAMKAGQEVSDALLRLLRFKGAGEALEDQLRKHTVQLKDVTDLLQDSGLSDESARLFATMGAGMFGRFAVMGFVIERDLRYAHLRGVLSARDTARHRDNLENLRLAHTNLLSKIEIQQDVYNTVCLPRLAAQTSSPAPIPPVEAVGPAPAATTAPSGGGSGPSWFWIGAGIGGAAAGGYLWEQYEKNKDTDGTNKCGPQPSISYNPATQSRPSDAQLNALRAWCTCNGLGFGQGSTGFGCLR